MEAARRIAATAVAEARKNGWTVSVAVVDIAGAIGVSGATSQQDGVCAQAAVNSLSKPPPRSAAPPAKK